GAEAGRRPGAALARRLGAGILIGRSRLEFRASARKQRPDAISNRDTLGCFQVTKRRQKSRQDAGATGKPSDDNRLLVFAEGAAEGVGNFADRGERLDGVEDGGHQVFGGAGAALDFGESGLVFGGIAAGAESVEARDLRSFDFGVDLEGGDGASIVGLE